MKNQVLEVDLKADITISKGESCNITGSIPGQLSDRYILLGAHYDGYFNAYIDDALGIGAVLNIAQAILRSGVIPKYTIAVSYTHLHTICFFGCFSVIPVIHSSYKISGYSSYSLEWNVRKSVVEICIVSVDLNI